MKEKRVAYFFPATQMIRQASADAVSSWNFEGKEYYIIGACAIPKRCVKEIDPETLAEIQRLEAQIKELQNRILAILKERWSNFKPFRKER